MNPLFTLSRRFWRVVPKPVRSAIISNKTLSRSQAKIRERLSRNVPHDQIYDDDYYASREQSAKHSADVIAQSVVDTFQPATAMDVGCGSGTLMQALNERGVDVIGLEYSEAGLKRCRERGLSVQRFDLEQTRVERWSPRDMVLSLEVAEHLPASCADTYVDLLTEVADRVIFTAAPPGQGGTDHVNEQPPAYWREKFAHRGFEPNDATVEHWRTQWAQREVSFWYVENLMIFERASAS